MLAVVSMACTSPTEVTTVTVTDTLRLTDTVTVTHLRTDTLIMRDTISVYDTIPVLQDSAVIRDSVVVRDSVVADTIVVVWPAQAGSGIWVSSDLGQLAALTVYDNGLCMIAVPAPQFKTVATVAYDRSFTGSGHGTNTCVGFDGVAHNWGFDWSLNGVVSSDGTVTFTLTNETRNYQATGDGTASGKYGFSGWGTWQSSVTSF